MNAATQKNFTDYKVADLALAGFGRKEIAIAETEMPGLMAVRDEYKGKQPLKGARIAGLAAHDHPDRGADRDPRRRWAPTVRWASCNIFSTQDHAAAAIAASGMPVFAYKGESLEEYWDYTHRILEWPDGGTPNMILDDGGDATLLRDARRARREGRVTSPPEGTNEEERVLFAAIAQNPQGKARLLLEASRRTSKA